jgi:hypothetical protein
MARSNDLSTLLERWGPYIGGMFTLACGLFAYEKFASWFLLTGINGKEAVGASFNVLLTLTAFLFSVFVLAIAPGQGFLQTILKTQTFLIFKRYVAEALVVGALATALSVPFMSTAMGTGIWLVRWAELAWISLTMTAILAFFRVAHIFLAWISLGIRNRNGGANN